jgi:hypothetical protein
VTKLKCPRIFHADDIREFLPTLNTCLADPLTKYLECPYLLCVQLVLQVLKFSIVSGKLVDLLLIFVCHMDFVVLKIGTLESWNIEIFFCHFLHLIIHIYRLISHANLIIFNPFHSCLIFTQCSLPILVRARGEKLLRLEKFGKVLKIFLKGYKIPLIYIWPILSI